jgi:hypothetical protein
VEALFLLAVVAFVAADKAIGLFTGEGLIERQERRALAR